MEKTRIFSILSNIEGAYRWNNQKIAVYSLFNRDFGGGDEFVADCLHSHRIGGVQIFSKTFGGFRPLRQKGRHAYRRGRIARTLLSTHHGSRICRMCDARIEARAIAS